MFPVCSTSPKIAFNNVDFPAPFLPIITVNSPQCTWIFTFFNTCSFPNFTLMLFIFVQCKPHAPFPPGRRPELRPGP